MSYGLKVTLIAATTGVFIGKPLLAEEVQTETGTDWSGFYAGLGVSASNLSARVGETAFDPYGDQFSLDASEGAVQGLALVGYNFDPDGPMVLGVEAVGYFGEQSLSEGQEFDGWFLPGEGSSSVELSDQFSLRGRVGFEIAKDWLLFGTAGVAQAQASVSGSYEHGFPGVWSHDYMTYDASETLTGYTVGLGAEHRFNDNISVRVDYMYSDFGEISADPTQHGWEADQELSHRLEDHRVSATVVMNF